MPVFHGSLHPTPILPILIPRAADRANLIVGSSISVLSIICAMWHAVVLAAEVKCIGKFTSFILISSQSVCDICALFTYLVLGIDICSNKKVTFPSATI